MEPDDGLYNSTTENWLEANESHPTQSLEDLNAEEARKYVGGAVFVGMLMIIGVVGNLHVFFVYFFRIKPSNHRIFILCLAVLDLITCSIGMPFVIYDLMYPLMFFISTACKILRFVNYFMCAGSALVLLVIAVERYRKICVPLSAQMSPYLSKVMCGVALLVALAMSWPAPILYGHSTIDTGVGNITGVRCFTADQFKKTKFQAMFNFVLIFIVVSVFTILVVLYSLIGRQIWRQRVFKPKTAGNDHSAVKFVESSTSKDSSVTIETPVNSSSDDGTKQPIDMGMVSSENGKKTTDLKFLLVGKRKDKYTLAVEKEKDAAARKKKDRTKKTTFMLFMITVVFFCSFMPHLILKIVTFMNKAFIPSMTFTESFLYNTFIWSFFINNMANPVIYGFCDMKFRKELTDGYARVFRRLCRRH